MPFKTAQKGCFKVYKTAECFVIIKTYKTKGFMKHTILPAIEIMIPVAEKDIRNIPLCVCNLKKYCINPIQKITIIGANKLKNKIPIDPSLRWIDEETISPSLNDIELELKTSGYIYKSARWYFQQLLKLYAFRIINPSTNYILIHDSDIAFVKETIFVDEKHLALLACGYPFRWKLNTRKHEIPGKHMAAETAQKFLPEWAMIDAYSGMQHHILLERNIIEELFKKIEQYHQREFWQAFINSIDRNRWHGISEYVIYRHFALAHFPEKVRSRHINAIDVMTSTGNNQCTLERVLNSDYPGDIVMLGCHQLTDYKRSLAASDYIPDSLRKDLIRQLTPLALYLDAGLLRIQPVQKIDNRNEFQLF
jgi:hypothetical protein